VKFFLALFIFLWQISARAEDLDLQLEKSEPVITEASPAPAPVEAAPIESAPLLSKPLNIKAGATLQNYRYEEPGLMSHTGILIGAWLNWNYEVPFYKGAVQSEINTGRIDYDGALCDVNSGNCVEYKSKTNDLIFRVSHRLGFEVNEQLQLFVGLGYRYLFDKGEGTGFYRRVGEYWMLPFGFSTCVMWTELNTKVVFDYEYDHFIAGKIESKLSDVNSTYSDVKHLQNKGRAQRLMVGFEPQVEVDNPHPWMFYFFYENWAIPQSESAELLINGQRSGQLFYEPENRSNAYGLRIGWAY